MVSEVGTKSNSNFAISFTLLTTKVCPIKAGTEFATISKSGSVTVLGIAANTILPGTKLSIPPVAITIPLSKPKFVFTALKKPI